MERRTKLKVLFSIQALVLASGLACFLFAPPRLVRRYPEFDFENVALIKFDNLTGWASGEKVSSDPALIEQVLGQVRRLHVRELEINEHLMYDWKYSVDLYAGHTRLRIGVTKDRIDVDLYSSDFINEDGAVNEEAQMHRIISTSYRVANTEILDELNRIRAEQFRIK